MKSLDVKDASIREVLDKCLKGTGFSYEIEDHVVIIRPDRPAKQEVKKVTLNGLVMDQDSVPIAGVTVLLKGTYVGVTTDITGKFQMAIPEQKEAVSYTHLDVYKRQGSHHVFIADVVNVQADDRYLDKDSGKFELANADPLV